MASTVGQYVLISSKKLEELRNRILPSIPSSKTELDSNRVDDGDVATRDVLADVKAGDSSKEAGENKKADSSVPSNVEDSGRITDSLSSSSSKGNGMERKEDDDSIMPDSADESSTGLAVEAGSLSVNAAIKGESDASGDEGVVGGDEGSSISSGTGIHLSNDQSVKSSSKRKKSVHEISIKSVRQKRVKVESEWISL